MLLIDKVVISENYVLPEQIATHGDLNKPSHFEENGFTSDASSFGYQPLSRSDVPVTSTSDSGNLNTILEDPKLTSPLAALKELVRCYSDLIVNAFEYVRNICMPSCKLTSTVSTFSVPGRVTV